MYRKANILKNEIDKMAEVDQKKKRTLGQFTSHGVDLDPQLDMSWEQLMQLKHPGRPRKRWCPWRSSREWRHTCRMGSSCPRGWATL